MVVMFTMSLSSWANNNTYYSKMTVTAVGQGKVYASTSSTNNPNYQTGSYTATNNSSSQGNSVTHTYYVYAQANGGYSFAGWFDNADCTGSAVSTNASYTYSVTTSATSSGSATEGKLWAKFVGADDPTDIAVKKIGPNSATVSWNDNASSYNVRYRKEGANTTTTYTFDAGWENWTTFTAWTSDQSNTEQYHGTKFKWALNSIDQTYRSYKADENKQYGLGHGGSADFVISGSYTSNSTDNTFGNKPIEPDNYLVSPKVTLGGTISFWAKGMDPADCAEKFGVFVSTTNNTSASAFTMVGEQKTATSEWTLYVFDLSAYDGQEGYVAIRHYDCYDQDLLCVDDISIQQPAAVGGWTENTGVTGLTKVLTGLDEQTGYQVCVQAVDGENTSNWVGTRFSTTSKNPVPAEVVVEPIGEQTATISWWGLSNNYEVWYKSEVKDGPEFWFDDFENKISAKWTTYTQGTGNTQYQGWQDDDPSDGLKFTAHSGTNVAMARSWMKLGGTSTPINADNWLVTPQVTLGNWVKFWVRTNPGYPDLYEVRLSLEGNTIANFNSGTVLRAMAAADHIDGWVRVSIPVNDNLVGKKGYIAIHHQCEDHNYLMIDDFGIFGPDEVPDPEEDEVNAEGWYVVSNITGNNEGYASVNLVDLIPNTTYTYRIIGHMSGEADAVTPDATFKTLPMDNLSLADDGQNKKIIDALHGLVDVNVSLPGRTLKGGLWNTLCLPFDVPLAGTSLASADIRTLQDAELDGTTLVLSFTNPGTITELIAGTPYIVKPNADITDNELKVQKVTIRRGMNPVECELGDGMSVTFKGTYNRLEGKDFENPRSFLFMGANGKSLKYPSATSYCNAQRAYFELVGITVASASAQAGEIKELVVDLDGEDPTGIEELFDVETTGAWYDLNGRKLNGKPSQKGIYINNGKKILK